MRIINLPDLYNQTANTVFNFSSPFVVGIWAIIGIGFLFSIVNIILKK